MTWFDSRSFCHACNNDDYLNINKNTLIFFWYQRYKMNSVLYSYVFSIQKGIRCWLLSPNRFVMGPSFYRKRDLIHSRLLLATIFNFTPHSLSKQNSLTNSLTIIAKNTSYIKKKWCEQNRKQIAYNRAAYTIFLSVLCFSTRIYCYNKRNLP